MSSLFCLFSLFILTVLCRVSNPGKNTTGSRHDQAKYAVQTPPLDTPWTFGAGKDPWSQYPRPQMERSEWISLNGIWGYQNASGSNETVPFGDSLAHQVLIPSCLESALSGIHGNYTIYSWFSQNFTVPFSWQSKAVLLNFGAVDYEATVYVSQDSLTLCYHLTSARSTVIP